MDYLQKLNYHFTTDRGWINDPNGLVFFKGYYHIFYQHLPDCETPDHPMHWGHARTKDFLSFEELPIALYPDKPYDKGGCWSGTAIVKDDVLYLFYASVLGYENGKHIGQTVSVAYSTDGIHFKKYENNPVIDSFPADGCPDFRDPAVCYANGRYYCVMASGNAEAKAARLLLYSSDDLLNWSYDGIMCEWENQMFAECPSFMKAGDMYLLTASVMDCNYNHFFSVMYGTFENGKFNIEYTATPDKGPDQYAGQVFLDDKGRNLLITWAPGWAYAGYAPKDVGCMSVPREIKLENGRITAFPAKEVQHLLTDCDEALIRTEEGFVINRQNREPVVYKGNIRELKMIRDGYILEVFINGGEEIYTVLL